MGGSRGFPRARRIRQGTEIRRILRKGRRKRTPHLEVFVLSAPAPMPRFGVIVPRHRNTIVKRNRLRRRLKEIGRVEVLPRLDAKRLAVDVLVRARPSAYEARFHDLRDQLVEFTETLCSSSSSSD